MLIAVPYCHDHIHVLIHSSTEWAYMMGAKPTLTFQRLHFSDYFPIKYILKTWEGEWVVTKVGNR